MTALETGIVLDMKPAAPKRVAIYARVSKPDRKKKSGKPQAKAQDPENQLRQLREWCVSGGHEIVTEYVEKETGTKGPEI